MLKLATAVVAGVIVVCIGLPVVLISAVFGGFGSGGGCGTTSALPTGPPAITQWDAEQVSIAAVILDVGRTRGVPSWGWVIAIATAMQESGLRNLPNLGANNDHDSIGVFQQRPSQGWGTPDQLADPAYQAGRFYDKLLSIPGWQSMPLTDAAQAVQRSAYPDGYAKWTNDAILLANQLAGIIAAPIDAPAELHAGCASTAGWVQPVSAPIVSGFRTPQRPDHDGVDLGAARGTPIRAASAGTVVTARCNITPASWGCDRDGNLSTPGCGWYVDIRHDADVYTRYCHMLTEPFVSVGQAVAAGQIIGIVGSSGHSSGPHLHYEVHLGDQASATAIDPVAYMAALGVPLGT